MVHYAECIDRDREAVIAILNDALSHVWAGLKHPFPAEVRLVYHRGWNQEKTLLASLRASLESDIQLGYTFHGPHRSDLRCKLSNNRSMFDFFSQGQQKLYTYALKFAQQRVLETQTQQSAIILIDDLPAELDVQTRQAILEFIHDNSYQSILSGLHTEDFQAPLDDHIIDLAASYVPHETSALNGADT